MGRSHAASGVLAGVVLAPYLGQTNLTGVLLGAMVLLPGVLPHILALFDNPPPKGA